MKFYPCTEFLKLPTGTMYLDVQSSANGAEFGGMKFRCDTGQGDFTGQWSYTFPGRPSYDSRIEWDRIRNKTQLITGSSPMDTTGMRTRCYEEDGAWFLVFEKDDLIKFKAMVDMAVDVAK